MSIAENIARVLERMAAAAGRAGRDPASTQLMAVSKLVAPEPILEAHQAGLRLFGENRVQEFTAKAAAVRPLPRIEWRLIGHLQSNKAARAAELFHGVDSLDSLRLAEKLDAAAQKLGRTLPVLIEVNLGGEAAKSGMAPDSPELEQLLLAAPLLQALQVRGLMAIPPFTADPEDVRPYFRRLRELRDAIALRRMPGITMEVLSMGMSHDFEVAIEEGSTCVRLGTAIFGERPSAR
ncbi:MAG: YggS family pyridoxal phosphate-dependent enzyme [Terriglobales bacterium]